MKNRSLLRKEAKTVYKTLTKNTKKRERIPFNLFYKRFLDAKKAEKTKTKETESTIEEDFDFAKMVNLNDIDLPDSNKE